ncbi:hypothetical protein MBLNU230_g2482t1 [Neophaeotheca triangularis]
MYATTATLLAAMAGTIAAQNNQSYYDYTAEGNPQLDSRTLATQILRGFPDCEEAPLAGTPVCNTSLPAWERASSLVSLLTLEELVNSTVNTGPEIARLGLPPYQVWNEALHGLSHYYQPDEGEFSWVTSFPQPIMSMASMNRSLIYQISDITSTQARAASNAGRYGLNVYSPNINGFRSPIWGRGQETPGEDAFFLSSVYALEYITAMQGGVNPAVPKMATVVKHFLGYDIEDWRNNSRLGNDVNITQQDLAGYYTPNFRAAIRDAKSKGLMCSYNAVNGEAACSSSFSLQTLLRDTWGFDGFVSSDCGAVYGVFNPHMSAPTRVAASAEAMLAGTDIDCGTEYAYYLEDAFAEGLIARDDIELALTRLYTQLVLGGYFDGNSSTYRDLTWDDVLATDAQNMSYEAAVEGTVLLKNDGTLPLGDDCSSIALIGPWANATEQMLGNYATDPPYYISPLDAFEASGIKINYSFGTGISSGNTTYFDEALEAARNSEVIVFAGGIDNTIEAEAHDREDLRWPGNQLELINQLGQLGKPLVVLQMGGGQVDDSALKANENVNAIIWGGYPGQSGGQALFDIATGVRAPAGRLTTTQYPASYADDVDQLNMNLRPDNSSGFPGTTYMWYTGDAVYKFGHGLFYTTFTETANVASNASASFNVTDFFTQPHAGYEFIEHKPLLTFSASVANTGSRTSDYSAMLFASTQNAGPAPYPNKWLVGIDREGAIAPGDSCTVDFEMSIGMFARAAENGDLVVYPGDYELALNNERSVVYEFTLTGEPVVMAKWPSQLPDEPLP